MDNKPLIDLNLKVQPSDVDTTSLGCTVDYCLVDY